MSARTKSRNDNPAGESARDRFRPLTVADVREMTDPGSFDRGRSYARSRQIFDGSVRGETLHASSHGSSGGPYRVEATLVPADDPHPDPDLLVSDYLCTCPRGGFCKHVVALLLTWIERPEVFAVRPTVGELLANRSREDLVALVELMVRREPDLADLIELAPPARRDPDAPVAPAEPGAGATRTVSPVAIRRQVTKAFAWLEHDSYDGWYGGPDLTPIVEELDSLLTIGQGYAAAGRWADAAVVFGTILDEAADAWEGVSDQEGRLLPLLGRVAAGLARCLQVQTDLPPEERLGAEDRAEIVEQLYAFWDFSSDYDVGADDEEPLDPAHVIAAHATDAERASVENWLRAIVDKPAAANEWSSSYDKRRAIRFLALLRGGMGDEETLAEFRKAELWEDATAMLLELNRVDEAVALAARKLTAPGTLTAFADRLVARGGADVDRALDLVEGRLWEKEGAEPHADFALLTWLGAKNVALGRAERAAEIERRRFKLRPGVDTYQAVRAAATLPGQPADRWVALRAELIATLAAKNDHASLVQIYLSEGETAEAIAALRHLEPGRKRPSGVSYGWGWSPDLGFAELRRRVAEAAERTDPDEAIRLYAAIAEDRIEGRQRPHYQAAAEVLARAKAVYLEQDRGEDWQAYILDLREKNKRLRALREELDALGLR